MEIQELHELSVIMDQSLPNVDKAYRQLSNAIQENVVSERLLPLGNLLDAVKLEISNFPNYTLSQNQISLLESVGIFRWIGPAAGTEIDGVISGFALDPLGTSRTLQEICESLGAFRENFYQVNKALNFVLPGLISEDRRNQEAIINVRFSGDCDVKDLVDLSKWSSEWHAIVRGIAVSIDETPENVKILSTRRGSLILVLGGTLGFTLIMARIFKAVGTIIREILDIEGLFEDLKSKKLLNESIEMELLAKKEQQKEIHLSRAIEEMESETKIKFDGEQKSHIVTSANKLVNFLLSGGSAEIVANTDISNDNLSSKQLELLSELRRELGPASTIKISLAQSETMLLASEEPSKEP